MGTYDNKDHKRKTIYSQNLLFGIPHLTTFGMLGRAGREQRGQVSV
jgi:hypothetical protein